MSYCLKLRFVKKESFLAIHPINFKISINLLGLPDKVHSENQTKCLFLTDKLPLIGFK